MKTTKPSVDHRRAYVTPSTEVAHLEYEQQLLAGSIEIQDGDFIHVGDVVSGNEDDVWE